MSFEFNEDQPQGKRVNTLETGMTQSLIKMGFVKNKKQANIFLLIFSALLLVVMMFFLSSDENEIRLESNIDPETYLPHGVTPPQ